MISILIKASIIVAIILLFYKLVLEKESFFASNRMYLLVGLAFSFALPFISLPQLIKGQGVVANVIEKHIDTPVSNTDKLANAAISDSEEPIETAENQKVLESRTETDGSALPINTGLNENLVKKERGILFWILAIYYFGVAVLSLNFIAQLVHVFIKIVRSSDRIKDDGYVIINSTLIKEPCSFFHYIFINPEAYDYDTYEQILAHEKLHVKKWHSIDLILSELTVIVLWFNPAVWLFRKEVEKNIEYQTDSLLLNNHKVEKDEYQMNLLKVATYSKPLTLTTNYNQSLLKNRIVKMSTKKSNPHSYFKYLFIAPMLLTILLALNKPQAMMAQTTPERPLEFQEDLQDQNEPNETKLDNSYPQVAGSTAEEGGSPFYNESEAIANECTPLLEAIRSENVAKVKQLIKTIDVNCIDPNPGYDVTQESMDGMTIKRSKARTPLTAAARVGNIEIGKLLVTAGAAIDRYAGQGSTPLSEAAYGGHTAFASFLVDKGADVNLSGGPYGSALASAAVMGQIKTAEFLISKKADVNLNGGGAYGSALASAANNGHTKMVELLVRKGADINSTGGAYGNALSTAANNGHTRTVEVLLAKGADINAKGGAYGTALNTAANNGHNKTVAFLLSNGVDIDAKAGAYGTALSTAANNGHTKTVEILLAKGADINVKGGSYGTPLNTAANNGHVKTVEFLLSKGADANVSAGAYGTAINTAANNGHIKTIEALIAKGANPNTKGGAYGTPLNTAANNGHNKAVEVLLKNGADIDLVAGAYGSALSTAVNNGHFSTVKLLVAKGANVNARGGAHGTPLSTAYSSGKRKIAEFLESKGAKLNNER